MKPNPEGAGGKNLQQTRRGDLILNIKKQVNNNNKNTYIQTNKKQVTKTLAL